jgi:hypothetical protein
MKIQNRSLSLFLILLGLVFGPSHIFAQNGASPDVLVTLDQSNISKSGAWEKLRRPEILRLFEDNVYGQLPQHYDKINYRLKREDASAMGGNAHLKEVEIEVFRNNESVKINLVLFIPNHTTVPAPAFVLINNRPADQHDPSRQVKSDFWPAEKVVASGYAIAAFQVGDAAPDHTTDYTKGVLRLYPEQLQKKNGMKALGAWAWGASRIMDYLTTDKDIDASRVAVVGHSRGGKAALWCGAKDERFAITISNDSGCGGAALSKRKEGETVARINQVFPHWFCDNFNAYNDREEEMPFDQHMLLALMAPRALYVSSASKDDWADPVGEFLSLKGAEPAFKLYRIPTLPAAVQPPVGQPVMNSHLGYHLREGGHNLTAYDWENFVKFADQHYGQPLATRRNALKAVSKAQSR